MKTLMAFLSTLLLSLGIAGCAQNAETNGSPSYSYNSNLGSPPTYGTSDSFGPSYTNIDNGSGF